MNPKKRGVICVIKEKGKLEAYMILLSSDSELKNCGSILCSLILTVKLLQGCCSTIAVFRLIG